MKTKILNVCKNVLTACMIFSFFSETTMASILFFGEHPYPNLKDYEN